MWYRRLIGAEMTKNLKTIIEEQRENAESVREHWENSPITKAYLDVPALNLQTYLILRHIRTIDQMDRIAEVKASTVPELASAIRAMVERDVIDSVWLSKGDLVWSIVFCALDEVDWEEVALEVGDMLRERSELLERARESGLLALIQADDDLPKN
jgi:hypothetical protein